MSNIINQIEQAQMRSDLPPFSQGDNVIVWVKVKEGTRDRLQAFEGLVIARKSRGLNSSFTVRKMSHGEGVERVFQDHSPIISHVEVTRYGKVRQAKLYYLRELSGRAARIKENLSKAKKYSELNKQQAAKTAEAAKAAKAADSAE